MASTMTNVKTYSREHLDMEQRLRPTHDQMPIIDLLLEADDVDSIYLAVALPGCDRDNWTVGQEIVRLPGYWPAKHPSADDGASDREARDAAHLFALLRLGDQDGQVAYLRVSRYAGMLLQTYEVF